MTHADAVGDGASFLERTQQLDALRESLAHVTKSLRGGTVLIPGEAGIGKTTLLRSFCHDIGRSAKVFWTHCDPLFTPRPLGPLLELADEVSSDLAAQIAAESQAFDVAAALFRELRRAAPAVVVIEDAHWADEATLDVVRLIARKIDSVPVLLAISYRDDHLDRGHPLQVVLGELSDAGRIMTRVSLHGLSKSAVRLLAWPTGVDPDELYERTAGNPFFVTEVLAADAGPIPHSIRDAVLARAARIRSPARDLLDAAAVVPGHIPSSLLEGLEPSAMASLDECLTAGILTAADGQVSFRHEIARLVLEESLPAGRRATLHRRMLSALEKDEDAPPDLARMVYHADAAGDTAAVLRYAPAAAEMAAAAGAHREASTLFGRTLEVGGQMAPRERVRLLERFAEEAYFTTVGPQATSALKEALEIHRSCGDLLGEGRTLRQLARHLGRNGAYSEGMTAIQQAVAVLERIPPSAELALAYVHVSSANYVALRHPEAITWGTKAITLGEQTGCPEAVYSGLNNIGSIEVFQGDLGGLAKLDRSREMAERARDSIAVGRAHLHACWMLGLRHEWRLAERYLQPAIAYCRDHGQELSLARLLTLQMEADLACGRWDQAVEAACSALAGPGPASNLERCNMMLVLAKVRARRGAGDYWPLLDEARDLGGQANVAYQLPSIAAARAEATWLEGRLADVATEADLARGIGLNLDPLAVLDLDCWRWRAGADIGDRVDLPEPYRMLLARDWQGAQLWWQEHGCPYEAALAVMGSADVTALRGAAEGLRALGAWAALAIVVRELRSLGERSVPREPRAATRGNPGGLTEREVEVLRLISAGMHNAEIAIHLYVSARTVDHHVAAILRKFSVRNRSDAVAAALRLGLVQT